MSVPTPPEAEGYLFTGWYNEPDCKTRFDFSKNIYCDTTAYASWYSTGNNKKIRYLYEYSEEVQITTSDDYQYIYFAPVTSGTYYLYYKNSSSSSTYAARMTIYNKTKYTNVKNETSVNNSSYSYYSFNATAGDIYYVCVSKYSSSSTFSCYLKPYSTSSTKGYFRTPDNVGAAGYQTEVSLSASTNNGYTFIGWYKGDEKISSDLRTTITAPSKNVVYTAKWIKCPVTLDKNIDEAGTVSGVEGATVAGKETTITATTNNGYTFIGWYDGGTKVCENLEYTFTMPAENKTFTAKWIKCPVTLEKNISEAGTVSGVEGATVVGNETTITATTNNGYTWLGWYDGETELTKELTYTFTMSTAKKTYTAKFGYACGNVTITKNINGGTFTITGNTDEVGSEVTLTATTNNGYTWLGWYDGEIELTKELTYTFIVTAENKTFTAKFEKCTSHTLNDNCVCTRCGATAHTPNDNCVCTVCGKTVHGIKDGNYCRHGNNIYFGTYPQSKVTDSTLTSALTTLAGTLPTSSNSADWTSYGYYISGNVSNFMWYIDKEYSGEKYRGVYFTSYRPYWCTYSSSTGNTYQDDNGYYTSTVYWFKYEPIKWRILKESDGKALILADLALDSQQFDYTGGYSYSNNYANSTIRAWLNNKFYNTAFTSLQKDLIEITNVDNSVSSTGYSSNPYVCENTEDNVFLLSYKEASTYLTSDSERQMKSSDYAKSQGCSQWTDSSYKGNCDWWLRSPCDDYSDSARDVSRDGLIGGNYYVHDTHYGVLPALVIRLS